MSEPIKVGDLVVIIRWSCCGYRVGQIFRVHTILTQRSFKCLHCHSNEGGNNLTVAWDGIFAGIGARLDWLKRIPPLSELEGEKSDEEITA